MRSFASALTGGNDRRNWVATVFVGLACATWLAVIQATSAYLIRQTNPAAAESYRSWIANFAVTLPSWLIVGLSTPLVLATARRYSFQAGQRGRSAVVHLVLSVVIGLVQLSVMAMTYEMAASRPLLFLNILRISSKNLGVLVVFFYWAMVAIYLVLRNSNLRVELAEAKVSALRAQLNPHFLFNTLNAASALASKGDHAGVVETLAALGALLRVTLSENASEVALCREIEFLETYVGIQRIRFPEQIAVDVRVSQETVDSLVPAMLLQPLVENSITYGLSDDRETLAIRLLAYRAGDMVKIAVEDDGPGFSEQQHREGIGLSNTRARLHHLYGSRHRFTYGTFDEGGAYVYIEIPFHETRAVDVRGHAARYA
jgi:signal transduction histidine kinase